LKHAPSTSGAENSDVAAQARKIVGVFARNCRPHELPLAFVPINIFGYSDVPIQIHNLYVALGINGTNNRIPGAYSDPVARSNFRFFSQCFHLNGLPD
jgi:hypothetical protein